MKNMYKAARDLARWYLTGLGKNNTESTDRKGTYRYNKRYRTVGLYVMTHTTMKDRIAVRKLACL